MRTLSRSTGIGLCVGLASFALAAAVGAVTYSTDVVETLTAYPRPTLPRVSLLDTDVLPDAGEHVYYRLGAEIRHAYHGGSPGWSFETVTADAAAFDGVGLTVAFRHVGGPLVVASRFEGMPGTWREDTLHAETDSVLAVALVTGPGLHIAYVAWIEPSAYVIRYARRDPGGWMIDSIDTTGVAAPAALAIGPGGAPRVAYMREDGSGTLDLRVARREGATGTFTVEVADSGNVGVYLSLAADPIGGEPRVAYEKRDADFNDYLAYAWEPAPGGLWTSQAVDSLLYDLQTLSLRLDAAGNPRVAYTRVTPILLTNGGSPLTGLDGVQEIESGELWTASRVGGGGTAPFALEPVGAPYNVRTQSMALAPSGLPIIASRAGFSQPPYDIVLSHAIGIGLVPPGSASFAARIVPNPRSGAAPIRVELSLPKADRVTLELFDVTGRRVANRAPEARPAGSATIEWSVGRVDAGLYWLRVRTQAGLAATRRCVLLP